MNIIIDTDSYKVSHWNQYPPGTTSMFSYIESRGGNFDKIVFFGLQYILEKYLKGTIVTREMVEEADSLFSAHGIPFNKEGWLHIVYSHNGKLPVRIRAVPEGSVINTGVPLVTIESTDPKCFWLVSWLETILVRLWYPINVATLSYNVKNVLKGYWEKTSDSPEDSLLFKLHDFGSRGASSCESAAIGGAAHLVNFLGSDTLVGIKLAKDYYDCEMAGYSIPAGEHSTYTSWGRDNESKAYENMLNIYGKPGAIFAAVSDSYDIYNACENIWGRELKQKVIDSGATVVIRPDSGIPWEVVPKILSILDSRFGSTINSKGYKVLNNVRVIQGDGVDFESIKTIMDAVVDSGFSIDNIAFGMGGGVASET